MVEHLGSTAMRALRMIVAWGPPESTSRRRISCRTLAVTPARHGGRQRDPFPSPLWAGAGGGCCARERARIKFPSELTESFAFVGARPRPQPPPTRGGGKPGASAFGVSVPQVCQPPLEKPALRLQPSEGQGSLVRDS